MNQNLRLPADRLYLSSQIKVAFVGNDFKDQVLEDLSLNFDISCSDSIEMLENTLLNSSFLDLPDVLLLEIDNDGLCFSFIERIKKQPSLRGLT
ncbi:MAG: hypothetical protein EOO45_10100 [Flavobacterium sp.]|nr:MAG: hypothetical protein EOO45_10100 [Flavobacterium sp.]